MEEDKLTILARTAIDLEMSLFEMKNELEEMSSEDSDEQIQNRLEEIKEIKKANDDIQEGIRIQMNEQKQHLLMKSFELKGIPDGAVENTEDLADILSKILNVPVQENTIAGFETLESEPATQSQCSSTRYTKITTVHMTERCYRDRIVHLARSKPLRLNDAEEPLQIKEALTRMNKMILKKTQQRASQLNISKVWVADGMIFIRKTDTSSSIQIRSEADIAKMHTY